jgi:hypothetical protein
MTDNTSDPHPSQALSALVEKWVELHDNPCRADHNGVCQAHFCEPMDECIVGLSRRTLATTAAASKPDGTSEQQLIAKWRALAVAARRQVPIQYDPSGMAAHNATLLALERCADELATLLPAPQQETWQPISTAPDTQVIRLFASELIDADFNPSGSVEGQWTDDEGWIGAVWNPCHDCWDTRPIQPTHWQPLPSPPAPHTATGEHKEGTDDQS